VIGTQHERRVRWVEWLTGFAFGNASGGGDIGDRTQVSLICRSDRRGVDGPVQSVVHAHLLVHIRNGVLWRPAVATYLGVAAVKAVCRELRAVVIITGGIYGVAHRISGTHPGHCHEWFQC